MSGNPIFGSKNQADAWATKPGAPVGFRDTANLSAEQLDNMYQQPAATSADMGRMTIGDTINKTIFTLGLVVIGAAIVILVGVAYFFWRHRRLKAELS